MNRYDAIVIGAGPAGATAALLLARSGRSVAIIEKEAFPRRKVCGEFISVQALALLEEAGVAESLMAHAGPEVREVAVYAGERVATAPMPRAASGLAYGRAIPREVLDAALLNAASAAGATVYQPWRVRKWEQATSGFECTIEDERDKSAAVISSPVLIAAHGSWHAGGLPLPDEQSHGPSDLLAFKARVARAALPAGRMPLIAFEGGYGGLVHTGGGLVSISCCIRRDALRECRRESPGLSAGEAVFERVVKTCGGVRAALGSAVLHDAWLAAGPLQPGIRSLCREGYFTIGNAMGEAHPIVAEGISMAIQSAWLLCAHLNGEPRAADTAQWNALAHRYETAYRRNFAPRIRAASAFAALAVRPRVAVAAAGMLASAPALLELGARFAGKARALRASA